MILSRLLIVAAGIVFSLSALAAEPAKPDNLTVQEVLTIRTALSNMNCQGGYIIRDGSKESVTCKVFDYVTDKSKIAFSRTIYQNLAATEPIFNEYNKKKSEFVVALDDPQNGGKYRDREGNLNALAQAKFDAWNIGYLNEKAGVSLRHFKRSDLDSVGLQPGIRAALKPIEDDDD